MKRNVALMIILSLALFLMNCEADKNPSIWNPNDAGEPTPTISSVNPPSQQYGGVGERRLVTITGTNYNSVADKNIVYFGKKQGDVIEASTTELVVAAPANYGSGLPVQVHVEGSYLPAFYGSEENPTPYEILSSESTIGFYDIYASPRALCVDGEGNLFITIGNRVDKVKPDGTIQENYLALKGKSSSIINSIKIGPDGAFHYIYAKYVFKTDTASSAHIYKNVKFNTLDMDFDANNNLWVVGEGKIALSNYTDMTTTDAYVNPDLKFTSCRVYNNDLYVVAKYVGADTTISKSPYLGKIAISGSTLSGDVEMIRYLDAEGFEDIDITGITFNKNGDMYIATKNYSLLYIKGDIATAEYEGVYPQILGGHPIDCFAWGIGEETYVNINDGKEDIDIKQIMLFEETAPVYGR